MINTGLYRGSMGNNGKEHGNCLGFMGLGLM